MTVSELLEQLKGLPGDALVLVPGYEGDWDTPTAVEATPAIRQEGGSVYGEYSVVNDYQIWPTLGEPQEAIILTVERRR